MRTDLDPMRVEGGHSLDASEKHLPGARALEAGELIKLVRGEAVIDTEVADGFGPGIEARKAADQPGNASLGSQAERQND